MQKVYSEGEGWRKDHNKERFHLSSLSLSALMLQPSPWLHCPMSGWLNKKVHRLPPLVQMVLAPHKPPPALKVPQSTPTYPSLYQIKKKKSNVTHSALLLLHLDQTRNTSSLVALLLFNVWTITLILYLTVPMSHSHAWHEWHHFLAEAAQHSAEDTKHPNKTETEAGCVVKGKLVSCHGGGTT